MSTSPPRPPTAPQRPIPNLPKQDGIEQYHFVADKIGGVPNLRWKDNLFQLAFVAGCVALGVLIGWASPWNSRWFDGGFEVLVGALIGLVGGVFLSGLALMTIGLIRKRK